MNSKNPLTIAKNDTSRYSEYCSILLDQSSQKIFTMIVSRVAMFYGIWQDATQRCKDQDAMDQDMPENFDQHNEFISLVPSGRWSPLKWRIVPFGQSPYI